MAADGASAAGAAGLAIKYGLGAKLLALFSTGVLSALIVAAVDPAEAMPDPKKRRRLIAAQVMTAGVTAMLFTQVTVRWLDSMFTWIDTTQGIDAWAEVALPVGLLWGSLSWGILGAAVKLRQLIRDRGAQALAAKAGLTD